MIHPASKLKVVHRNIDSHNLTRIVLTSGLQEVCHDLRDIATIIEKQFETSTEHSSFKDPLLKNIKA